MIETRSAVRSQEQDPLVVLELGEEDGDQLVPGKSVFLASTQKHIRLVEEEHRVLEAAQLEGAIECFFDLMRLRAECAGSWRIGARGPFQQRPQR